MFTGHLQLVTIRTTSTERNVYAYTGTIGLAAYTVPPTLGRGTNKARRDWRLPIDSPLYNTFCHPSGDKKKVGPVF